MNNRFSQYMKNTLFPCLAFSVAVGLLSAILITIFKIGVTYVIDFSTTIYDNVRENPKWLPLLISGAAAIGLIASFILSRSQSCRGGGIPTSVGAIRGIFSFKWIESVFILPLSALLTFFCGLPLGTEGPCVQMGAAIGDGIVKCAGSGKTKGWRRYIMTGGASAGFSIAASSPIAAIVFSMEELHKHFSPMLLTISSVSVLTAQAAIHTLASFGIGTVGLFHIPNINAIPPKLLFAPLIVGILCGVCSILFTHFYHFINKLMRSTLKRVSTKIVFPLLFALVAITGFFLSDALGTGHHFCEHLLETRSIWYMLIIIFLLRMIFMMLSNTSGVTGGIFLPTIAFGAILGALCAEGMISLNWLDESHYVLIVVLGITSFLGATSRIPITACIFAVEVLGGMNNALSIIISTTVALLIVESSGLEDFTDTVIETNANAINKGKKPSIIVVSLVVNQDSFVVGKELRDILWPNACTVISVERSHENHEKIGICHGDVITVRYETYNPSDTAEELEILVGAQSEQNKKTMNPNLQSA